MLAGAVVAVLRPRIKESCVLPFLGVEVPRKPMGVPSDAVSMLTNGLESGLEIIKRPWALTEPLRVSVTPESEPR